MKASMSCEVLTAGMRTNKMIVKVNVGVFFMS